MHTSLQLIDLAKQRLALKHDLTLPVTDYRCAKLMGIHVATFSSWITGRTAIGTKFVRKFADACELPEAYVYACIEHERATPEMKGVLEKIAEVFSKQSAAAILAVMVMLSPSLSSDKNSAFAASDEEGQFVDSVYYGKSRRQRRKELLQKLRDFLTYFPALPHGDALQSHR